MKHAHGIDLIPANDDFQPAFDVHDMIGLNLENLREWYVLGGKCSKCRRYGWVDRKDIERRFGRQAFLAYLRPLLRCTSCGNKGDNRWIIGKIGR